MSIMKKGVEAGIENYSGVTLMAILYKEYAMVLAEKLREEKRKKENAM